LNTDGLLVSQSDSIYDLAANNYSFIITDSTNCSASAEITISEPQEILVDHIIDDESCVNLNDGSISTTVYDYQNSFETFWSSNMLSGLENNNVAPGLYVITVVDNVGCFVTDSLTVISASNLEFISTITAPECNYIPNGQLEIDFANEGVYSVLLESSEIGFQANGNNGVSFNELFASDYNLTIAYNQNCVFDTLITIESNDGYSCIVTEPTFSPNFDGVNDSFIPMLNFDQNVELSVFNQWGVRVFYEESSFPTWDGQDLNGSILPTADYYYIIKFNNQFYKDITGIITLLK
jgi:gliding motility-associated-like protein